MISQRRKQLRTGQRNTSTKTAFLFVCLELRCPVTATTRSQRLQCFGVHWQQDVSNPVLTHRNAIKPPYGRVLRIPDKTNRRLFGSIPYGSEHWKEVYKNRTSCEHMNKRLLRDYHVEDITCRDGNKLLFFSIMAGILTHLDAWIKIGR